MRKARFLAVLAFSAIGLFAVPTIGSADTPTAMKVAIPRNVTVLTGVTEIVFVGRPTSTSPINCSPGTPQPQTVRLVHPASGRPADISGVLAFHDHEIPLGSRFQVTEGPSTCNAELSLYTVESV